MTDERRKRLQTSERRAVVLWLVGVVVLVGGVSATWASSGTDDGGDDGGAVTVNSSIEERIPPIVEYRDAKRAELDALDPSAEAEDVLYAEALKARIDALDARVASLCGELPSDHHFHEKGGPCSSGTEPSPQSSTAPSP